MSNIAIPPSWPYKKASLPAPAAADVTVALSESAITRLVRMALDNPIDTSGGGTWGPFVASYRVHLSISSGTVQLVTVGSAQIVRLTDVVVNGSVNLSVGLDLGRVLPHICIPPWRACIHTPWGDVCTPQVCIAWPTISIPIPIPIPPLGLSADFGVRIDPKGSDYQVDLLLYPLSLYVDLTPTVDLIIATAKVFVHDTIGRIPLIGGLLDSLVDAVLNALKGVLDAILSAIKDLIRTVILAIDLFSPTIPFPVYTLPKEQVIMPDAGPGDAAVTLEIATITPTISDKDLILSLSFT